MVALFFEVYGALCLFALIAFLVWAAVAKLRPDLDEGELNLAELENPKTLVSPGADIDSPPIEPLIVDELSPPPPSPPVKRSTRPIRRRTVVFQTRHPRTT